MKALISPEVLFRSDSTHLIQDFSLRVMLLLLNPFSPEVVSIEVDHCYLGAL
jgi:hypothetical protein